MEAALQKRDGCRPAAFEGHAPGRAAVEARGEGLDPLRSLKEITGAGAELPPSRARSFERGARG